MIDKNSFRVAVLDMNKGHENQGIQSILRILDKFQEQYKLAISVELFEVRLKAEIPSLDYDAYISSGGPGSPFDGLGSAWEAGFFRFLDDLLAFNKNNSAKKYLFLICHSFQMACRKFNLGQVIPRYSNSFGVFPIYMTELGEHSEIFKNLGNPFYALDSRDWQVIKPNMEVMNKMGGKILALEKERVQINLDRCLMAIQFSPEVIGTQFHPEADSIGLNKYFKRLENKETIVATHSKEKYNEVIASLANPERIKFTQETILPNFLKLAFQPKFD